ncbi:PREDICTED: olfactory receptor 2F1-like [Nanorana parkeri]|uniref:olfactory receptor 2F1-like n=1 Tax=Nanorana parkeri TaxID=125878 RepID=UPI000854BC43|nr:PREDICTED: olfactory receptor 2F1-like [Nanorana parkeri]
MSLENKTMITEIILLGFSADFRTKVVLFVVFLVIYVATLVGNYLIIIIIIINPHLRTPMYFFLCILSLLDLGNSSSVVPRMLYHLLSAQRSISLGACTLQFYTIMLMGGTECLLLALMAYDRYVAICRPLRYPVVMRWSVCYRLTALLLIISFFLFVFPSLSSPMALCNPNRVNHYMCELLAIIKLACVHVRSSEVSILVLCFTSILLPFVYIIVTYGCIIAAVLQIKSAGRSKAFSTCTSHISVVALYFGTGMVMYFGSSSDYSTSQGKYISVFYNIVCPMLNPIIYSLNNKEVKETIKKLCISSISMTS